MAEARLSIGVSADAKQASAAFKDLAEDIKKVGGASVGIASAVDKAKIAFDGLAKAKDSPGAIATAMARARDAVRELNVALAQTPPGSAEYQRISDALTRAGTAMQTAAARAAHLKGVQDQVAAAVSRYSAEANKAANSTTVLGDAMRKQTERFNKFRGATMEVWAAFGIGKQVGEALAAAIDKVSARMAAHDRAVNDAAVNTIRFEAAMRLAERGLIGLGGSQEDFIRAYDAYVAKTSPATRATEAQTRALEEQKRAWVELKAAMDAAAAGKAFEILSPEDADAMLDPIRSLATGLENALKKAFEVGGEAERDAWAAANEEAVQKVIAAYEKMGAEVPEHIKAVGKARQEDASGLNAWIAAMDAATQSILAQRAALNDLDIATGQWLQNQQRMSNLSGQTAEFMKAAEDQFRKTGEAIYTMTIMQTDWTKATEGQIEALRRMNESLNETWDGSGPGQRALDAIAQLVDLFKAGVLSLDGFNKSFAYLEEQLNRVIMAGGDLDGTLSGVLAALRKIAQQVRMGPGGRRPSGPVGY